MKRFCLSALLLTMLAGCSHSGIEEDAMPSAPQLYAEIADESGSRTYLEQAKYMRWHADDEISAFLGNTLNQRYGFDGKTGANSGTFSQVSYQLGTGNPIEEIRAFYPYAASTSFDDIAGKVNYIFPKLQQYGEGDTYGQGANPMVATSSSTSDTFLYFRNICGFLKLQLYGDDVTVKAILVKGNQAEKLSGASVITAEYNADPSVAMADEATEGVVLDCGEGVVLSEDANNPTLFWIAIPPTTFEGGFTITIKGDNGKGHIQSTTKQRIITRNEYLQMPTFAVVCNKEINEEDFQENAQTEEQVVIPNNQIWYTSASGLPINVTVLKEYGSTTVKYVSPKTRFGANIISHIFDGEKFVITFDADVTKIGAYSFREAHGCSLTSITIPSSVTTIEAKAFANCTSLKDVFGGNGITEIGSSAFNGCTSLIFNKIPDWPLENVGTDAFISVTFTDTWDSIDSSKMLLLKEGGADVDLILDIPEIQDYAFEGCNNLRNITFSENVTSIGASAFDDCPNLEKIVIGKNVKSIGASCFLIANGLMKFYYHALTPPRANTSAGMTVRNNNKTTIYVPTASVDLYKAAYSSRASWIQPYDFE